MAGIEYRFEDALSQMVNPIQGVKPTGFRDRRDGSAPLGVV